MPIPRYDGDAADLQRSPLPPPSSMGNLNLYSGKELGKNNSGNYQKCNNNNGVNGGSNVPNKSR